MLDDLIRLLLQNKFLLLLILLSVLPALGRGLKNMLVKAAEQAKKNQERMRRDDGSMPRGPREPREAGEPREPSSHEPEDIAREIRRMMGMDPVAEPVEHEPPQPPPRPPRVHRERKPIEVHVEPVVAHAEPSPLLEPIALVPTAVQLAELLATPRKPRAAFRLGDPRRAMLLLEVLSAPVGLREADERW